MKRNYPAHSNQNLTSKVLFEPAIFSVVHGKVLTREVMCHFIPTSERRTSLLSRAGHRCHRIKFTYPVHHGLHNLIVTVQMDEYVTINNYKIKNTKLFCTEGTIWLKPYEHRQLWNSWPKHILSIDEKITGWQASTNQLITKLMSDAIISSTD